MHRILRQNLKRCQWQYPLRYGFFLSDQSWMQKDWSRKLGSPSCSFLGCDYCTKKQFDEFSISSMSICVYLIKMGRGRRMMGNLWWNDTGCIYTYLYVLITSLSSDSFGSQWLTPLSSSFYWFFASYLEKFTSEAGLLKLPKTIWESWLFHTFVIVYNGGIFGIFGILQQL